MGGLEDFYLFVLLHVFGKGFFEGLDFLFVVGSLLYERLLIVEIRLSHIGIIIIQILDIQSIQHDPFQHLEISLEKFDQ